MADEHLISLQPGTVIAGRYEVVKCLGSGSMGLVYACRHRELAGHMVAAKVLFPEVAQDKVAAARFRNEIFASYGVSHPNVVRAYEYLRDGDILAYTMEYVGGGDLAHRLGKQNDPISVPEIIRLLAQMCSGVQAIHDAGIVHRDLKPENILLTKEGVVKIADFGIARTGHGPKLTEHGGVVGTIDYVSPEYMLNSQVDWRSDIYAIGILAYEMVTGESPFRGDSVYATMTKRLKSDPAPPSSLRPECPPQLDAIILRAMQRNPEERYQSASEMYRDLVSLSPDVASVAAPPPAAPSIPRAPQPPIREELSRSSGSLIPPAGENTGGARRRDPSPLVDQGTQLYKKPPPYLEPSHAEGGSGEGYGVPVTPRPLQATTHIVLDDSRDRRPYPAVVSSGGAGMAGYVGSRGRETPMAPVAPQPPMRPLHQDATQVINHDMVRVVAHYDDPFASPPVPQGSRAPVPYRDPRSRDWDTPGEEVSMSRGGIDEERIKSLSEFVDNVNRSVWVDAVTLIVAVLIGVGVGFAVLRMYFPDLVETKSAQNL